jgi:hypothetical protein
VVKSFLLRARVLVAECFDVAAAALLAFNPNLYEDVESAADQLATLYARCLEASEGWPIP